MAGSEYSYPSPQALLPPGISWSPSVDCLSLPLLTPLPYLTTLQLTSGWCWCWCWRWLFIPPMLTFLPYLSFHQHQVTPTQYQLWSSFNLINFFGAILSLTIPICIFFILQECFHPPSDWINSLIIKRYLLKYPDLISSFNQPEIKSILDPVGSTVRSEAVYLITIGQL